jgi:F-type H+/Na+-transporting ATPase subunit alpha
MVEVLKQNEQEPLSIHKQIVMLYAATRGHVDRYALADIRSYESELYTFFETRHTAILATLADGKAIDGPLASLLDTALEEFETVRKTVGLAAAA